MIEGRCERSDGERNGTGAPGRTAVIREGRPAQEDRRRARPATRASLSQTTRRWNSPGAVPAARIAPLLSCDGFPAAGSPCHRLEDPDSDGGFFEQQLAERWARDLDGDDPAICHHRRRSRSAVEQRHLTEEVAGAKLGNGTPAGNDRPVDLRASVDDDVEGIAPDAALHDHPARGEGGFPSQAGDPSHTPSRQFGEERDLREEGNGLRRRTLPGLRLCPHPSRGGLRREHHLR